MAYWRVSRFRIIGFNSLKSCKDETSKSKASRAQPWVQPPTPKSPVRAEQGNVGQSKA
jgi:hypothetical protein